MKRGVSVYYLLDPQSGSIRYVGIARKPSKRLREHCHATGRSHRATWIRSLLRAGLRPEMSIKCVVSSPDEAKRIEIALIALLRARGCDLTNGTRGGDGIIGYRHTAEQRAKWSAARTGHQGYIPTEEDRAAMRQAWVRRKESGWAPSVEARAKMRASHLGKTQTPETRLKESLAMRGKNRGPMSDSHKDKLRIAATGKSHVVSDESRNRMSTAQKGLAHQRHTPESRAKISASLKWRQRGPHSDTHRANLRRAWERRKARGWQPSKEARRKMASRAFTGHKHSAISKQRMSESQRLRFARERNERAVA